jgi:hypothetical protein
MISPTQRCEHHAIKIMCGQCSPLPAPPTFDTDPEDLPFQPLPARARVTDPETSHDAAAVKDDRWLWAAALRYVAEHGPSTEETILLGIGLEQRSSGSSTISQMVKQGALVNIIDPATGKPMRGMNTSGHTARLRGLPSQQPMRTSPAVIADQENL